MTSMPTRNSVQASDRRWAITVLLSFQEAFYVVVLGFAQHFIRSFENNFSVAKHEKSCIRDAEKIAFRLKTNLLPAVDCVFGCQCERIAHAVRDENRRDLLGIPQCDDEFVDLFRGD